MFVTILTLHILQHLTPMFSKNFPNRTLNFQGDCILKVELETVFSHD